MTSISPLVNGNKSLQQLPQFEHLPSLVKLNMLSSGPESEVEITIREGKFHQIKRMFEAVDKKVVYLKRLSMGSLRLDETLALGEYRELTEDEVQALKESKGHTNDEE